MAKPENPPAFPRTSTAFVSSQDGMNLRDWFAGRALTGLLAYPDSGVPSQTVEAHVEHFAALSYLYADAMLSARQTTDREGGK